MASGIQIWWLIRKCTMIIFWIKRKVVVVFSISKVFSVVIWIYIRFIGEKKINVMLCESVQQRISLGSKSSLSSMKIHFIQAALIILLRLSNNVVLLFWCFFAIRLHYCTWRSQQRSVLANRHTSVCTICISMADWIAKHISICILAFWWATFHVDYISHCDNSSVLIHS